VKIALISDIHSNLPALEAVLSDIPSAVDQIICLGDIVGYGPYPLECARKTFQQCDVVLQGNHDREVTTPVASGFNDQAIAGLQYANEQLDDRYREWLQNLSRKISFNDNILLVHDHPEEVDRYVLPSKFPRVRPHMDNYRACFLGHTHIQHEAVIDDRLILNPGSVGQPRDGDNRAAYAVVETDDWETDLRRVEYDIQKVQARVNEVGLPIEIGNRLAQGK
jgi:putative phosphoesterase